MHISLPLKTNIFTHTQAALRSQLMKNQGLLLVLGAQSLGHWVGERVGVGAMVTSLA